jgi:hypothetical protein
MMSKFFVRAPLLLFLALAHAQEAPPAPAAPAAKPASIVRPGMLWGAVIMRDEFQRLTGRDWWSVCWRQTWLRPGAFFGRAGPALGAHLNNKPPEWGQSMEGYSKRLANLFARSAMRESVTAAGSAAPGYDVRDNKCDCNGLFPRFGHAIAWNFLALNRDGNAVLDVPGIGGAFGGEFIGRTWMPPGYKSVGDTFRGGAVQMGVSSLFNAIREFAPRKKAK